MADAVEQLESGLHALRWATGIIPPVWAHRPDGGGWSAATNLAHLLVYEEQVSVPVVEDLLRGEDGTAAVIDGSEGWLAQASESLGSADLGSLALRWEAARARLIAAVRAFRDDDFNAPTCAVTTPMFRDIGLHPAGLVVLKANQHTWEHGNAILRTARLAYSRPVPPAS